MADGSDYGASFYKTCFSTGDAEDSDGWNLVFSATASRRLENWKIGANRDEVCVVGRRRQPGDFFHGDCKDRARGEGDGATHREKLDGAAKAIDEVGTGERFDVVENDGGARV